MITNARMYSVNEAVAELWSGLFDLISRQSGVLLDRVDHPAPAPLDALWQRQDMGLVQMCGWPLWRAEPRPLIVAAPVPDHPLAGDLPVYWTDMVVRSDSPATTLEETFGERLAWTIETSHSGFNAPRKLLLPFAEDRQAPLYRDTLGPLVTPARMVDAIVAGEAEVGPLDGYYHLLLRRHAPDRATAIKTIAVTPIAPMPPLVASPGIDPDALTSLRKTLMSCHEDGAAAPILEELAIKRFAVPDLADYETQERWHREAVASNYLAPH